MKAITKIALIISGLLVTIAGSAFRVAEGPKAHVLETDDALFYEIAKMDSIYFTAYNTCDMKTQAMLYDEDLEFYHDKGGLSTSKEQILTSIEENICGKVTRELIKGSLVVYPINGFGAVEIGMHKFHNSEEPDAIAIPSKFITIWRKETDSWKISRVVSLHN